MKKHKELHKRGMICAVMAVTTLLIAGCTTSQGLRDTTKLADQDTGSLCRIASHNADEAKRREAIDLLIKRSVNEERCNKIMKNDKRMLSVALGIPVGTISDAVGVGRDGYAWDEVKNPD